MRLRATLLGACIACAASWATAADPLPPAATELAEGIWLIPGSFPPQRNPDGNTVVFRGNTGLVVMDTGRHRWHRDGILAFVRSKQLPVTAIINSHWHLDHTSGNIDIKREWPNARLYTSTAVLRMMRDVWPQSEARSRAFLEAGKAPDTVLDDVRGDMETRRQAHALVPDEPVTASGTRVIDGLALELHLAGNAATDGDTWVYEPRSRIAVAGDLITLPVPFLDTACTKGWRDGLAQVAATPFLKVVPGHGAPMDRSQFDTYRAAFGAYADCAHGTQGKAACAAGWMRATAALRAPEPEDDARTREMAEGYVELLRANGGNSALCAAK